MGKHPTRSRVSPTREERKRWETLIDDAVAADMNNACPAFGVDKRTAMRRLIDQVNSMETFVEQFLCPNHKRHDLRWDEDCPLRFCDEARLLLPADTERSE